MCRCSIYSRSNAWLQTVLGHHPSWQLADILTKGLHYQQWQACVEGILSKKVRSIEGTPVLKRGWIAKAYKSSHVDP
jgi:hypothetical protein